MWSGVFAVVPLNYWYFFLKKPTCTNMHFLFFYLWQNLRWTNNCGQMNVLIKWSIHVWFADHMALSLSPDNKAKFSFGHFIHLKFILPSINCSSVLVYGPFTETILNLWSNHQTWTPFAILHALSAFSNALPLFSLKKNPS